VIVEGDRIKAWPVTRRRPQGGRSGFASAATSCPARRAGFASMWAKAAAPTVAGDRWPWYHPHQGSASHFPEPLTRERRLGHPDFAMPLANPPGLTKHRDERGNIDD